MNGSGPLYDELHPRFEEAVEPQPVHRFLAGLAPIVRAARRAAPADRLHAIRPRDRAGVRGGGGGGRRRHVRRRRAQSREVLAPAAGRGATSDRRAEHVRHRVVARAAHGAAQAARRGRSVPGARVGELRDHGGRLHRLPRPLRRRQRRFPSRSPRGSAAAISSSSGTRWSTGTSGSSCTASGATGPSLIDRGQSTRSRRRSSGRSGAASRSTCSTSSPTSTSGCSSVVSRRSVSVSSPYRGLAPFEDSEVDALYFFGRERDTEIVVANLIASRLTVLYGPSGVGKSSLLFASVARALRELPEAPVVVVFSSWREPAEGPGRRRRRAVRSRGRGAGRSAERAQAGRDVYLILDQAEEYFTYHESRRVRRGARGSREPAAAGQRAALASRGHAGEPRSPQGGHSAPLRERAPPRPARPRGRTRGDRRAARRWNELEGDVVLVEDALVEACSTASVSAGSSSARAVSGPSRGTALR